MFILLKTLMSRWIYKKWNLKGHIVLELRDEGFFTIILSNAKD